MGEGVLASVSLYDCDGGFVSRREDCRRVVSERSEVWDRSVDACDKPLLAARSSSGRVGWLFSCSLNAPVLPIFGELADIIDCLERLVDEGRERRAGSWVSVAIALEVTSRAKAAKVKRPVRFVFVEELVVDWLPA
jgi:hypothetical protein